ncbi:(R)-mandelonitrile lyase [Thetidibacter halocola]|uniref:Cupin domain-containing protein n=1 Tax=Thetidibacter halocola TaxID=2827239 RepID=A0A8J7WBS1_9RHOB|nr:cupin domain-containing protein [Thetidibacter halocola]MBS0124645.1 cupin domain-containing protein [Thetidibacter halocola]
MEIHRAGSRPSQRPNPDYFTGAVRMDPIASSQDPSRVNAVIVTFEPGARTAWHMHPLGQTIHILSGLCLAQRAGGPVEELRPGDTCRFAPGEKHWHGAAPEVGMAHLAIQEAVDGSAADWLEQVSDADYAGRRAAQGA